MRANEGSSSHLPPPILRETLWLLRAPAVHFFVRARKVCAVGAALMPHAMAGLVTKNSRAACWMHTQAEGG